MGSFNTLHSSFKAVCESVSQAKSLHTKLLPNVPNCINVALFSPTVTVAPTASVNGRNETKSASESWRSVGKKRRLRSSAGYVSGRRRKMSKRKKTKIRVKRQATVTATTAQIQA